MNILAETLWNKEVSFDSVCENVLKAEYGDKWESVRDYLKALSDNNYAKLLRKEEKYDDTYKAKLEESLKILADYKPEIEKGLSSDLSQNWKKMELHNKLYSLMVEYVLKFGTNEAEEIGKKVVHTAHKNEEEFKDVFDGSYFVNTFEQHYPERLKLVKEQ